MARIPPEHVGEMDQQYAKAKANLTQHVEDFCDKLGQGDATETVVLGFAQEILKSRPNTHLAFMLATAIMALAQPPSVSADPRFPTTWPKLRSADGRGGHGSLQIEINGAFFVLAAYNVEEQLWHISPINGQAHDTGLLALPLEVLHDPAVVRKVRRR